MPRTLFAIAALFLTGLSFGQFNTGGRFHASIGAGLGGHSTSLEQRYKVFGVTVSNTRTGSAATTTLPIELGVGVGKVASIGLGIELGRYVPDTNATDQRNSVAVVTIMPRFYLLNRDRIALSASMQLGAAALRILEEKTNAETDQRYSGPAFGIGAGAHFGLSDHVGLELHVRYLATRMELRAAEFNGSSVMDFYNATLTTGGVIAQLSLSFRFGGN